MKDKLFKIRYLFLIVSLLMFIIIVFLLSSVLLAGAARGSKPPTLLGNHRENIMRINDEEGELKPFTFFVVGDIGLKGYFENFIKENKFDSKPDFGFLLGDLVKNPEVENHDFFNYNYSRIKLYIPIFLLVGNHDIALGEYGSEPNAYFLEDFVKTYGPVDYYFKYHGCLFVIANDNYNDDYLKYLREVLESESKNAAMIFVLMHVPPTSIIPAREFRPMMGEEKFFSLMKEFDVDYFFSGDFHSYYRSCRDGTNYIITGGGGSRLCYDGSGHSFHHSMLISVNPETKTVNERVYSIDAHSGIVFDYEKLVITKVYPDLIRDPLFSGIIIFLILLVMVSSFVIYLKTARKGKNG